MLKRLHSLGANATCGIADVDYTEWRNFNPHRKTIRPSLKKLLLYPYLPTFTPTRPLPTSRNLENKTFFLPYFHQKITIFPIMEQWKKNIYINLFFPTYLPNQKIQGRDTANKHCFKDGLIDSFFLQTCHLFLKFVISRTVRFGSAPIYAFDRHVVSTIMQSNETSRG